MNIHEPHNREWQAEKEQLAVNQALRFTERQLGLTKDLTELLNREDVFEIWGERISLTSGLLFGAFENANTITSLAIHHNIDSGYMLARALVERAVNYCFLLVCDDKDFQDWVGYSKQKAFRMANREASVGDLKVQIFSSGLPDPSQIPGLEEEMDKFTSSKGRPINRWTNYSMSERIDIVRHRAKDFDIPVLTLLGSLALVYDVASEALHGTLFGVTFSLGLFQPQAQTHAKHVADLLGVVGFCLDAMIRLGSTNVMATKLRAASQASLEAYMEVGKKTAKITRSESDTDQERSAPPRSVTPGPELL